ncbi:DNA breaking-rejoining protein, partial [Salmonella enterica]|nr:DNA breaking-rejoining protein [Salmonella enterica]
MKNSPLIWRGFIHPEFKTGGIMEIVKIEMNLKAVNKSIALFNCENLDGGYVLGKFD